MTPTSVAVEGVLFALCVGLFFGTLFVLEVETRREKG